MENFSKTKNSSRHWDYLWTSKVNTFHTYIPTTEWIETFFRYWIYFKAIDRLLGNIIPGEKILELGSGTGRNSLYLASTRKAKSVTLLDFSEKALSRAQVDSYPCPIRKIHKNLLKFSPGERYDFVHSTGLIEHFTGRQRSLVIKKHSQCARSGGLIMIWVPVISPTFNCIGKFNQLIGIEEIPFTKDELRNLCWENGLEIIGEAETAFGALYGILCRKN